MVSPVSLPKFPISPRPDSEIDWGALRAFVAIADAGSFTGGGRVLGLTRSAVGKALTKLEARLAVRLLHRTTRHVVLTSEGQHFYERCVQIFADLAEAEASVSQNGPAPKGQLRITVTEAFGRVIVLPFLKQFLADWPELNVEVSFTDRVVDLVEEGFDLGIRLGELPVDSQLIAKVILRTQAHLYAAPEYLHRAGWPSSPADIQNYQRLIFGLKPAASIWQLVADDGEQLTIGGGQRLRFDSGEALKDAAIEGMGIVYLPHFLMVNAVKEGRLVTLFPQYSGHQLPVSIVYPHRKYLATKIRVFIDQLVAYLDESTLLQR